MPLDSSDYRSFETTLAFFGASPLHQDDEVTTNDTGKLFIVDSLTATSSKAKQEEAFKNELGGEDWLDVPQHDDFIETLSTASPVPLPRKKKSFKSRKPASEHAHIY